MEEAGREGEERAAGSCSLESRSAEAVAAVPESLSVAAAESLVVQGSPFVGAAGNLADRGNQSAEVAEILDAGLESRWVVGRVAGTAAAAVAVD